MNATTHDRRACLAQLDEVYQAGRNPKNDMFLPITSKTRHVANAFINALPDDIESPVISGEVTGDICATWKASESEFIALVICDNGKLILVEVNASGASVNSFKFKGEIPLKWLSDIRRLKS